MSDPISMYDVLKDKLTRIQIEDSKDLLFWSTVLHAWHVYSRKNHDYTMADPDPFHNFKATAELAGTNSMQAWFTHFYKHFAAVATLCKTGKVESEGIEGRFIDIINYAILGLGLAQQQGGGSQ